MYKFSRPPIPSLRPVKYAFVLVLMFPSVTAHSADARRALVIGNGAYPAMPIESARRDARSVAAKLETVGFKVERVEDLKRRDIGRTIASFAKQIQPGDTAVIYYVGHGIQVKGVNYLPAVDAQIEHEDDVALNSANLSTMLERLEEAKAGVKLVLIDAGRPNGFKMDSRGLENGLARVTSAPAGTLVQFASRPGTAIKSAKSSFYSQALLDELTTPDIPVEVLLKRVSQAVSNASKGEQIPWAEGSISGDFYFKESAPGERPRPQVVQAPQMDWNAWQAQMQASFDEAQKTSGTPEIKAEAWKRFLVAWQDDNPTGTQDEALRKQAEAFRAELTKPVISTRRLPSVNGEIIVWQWPADGAIVSNTGFSGKTGALIAGKPGTPVVSPAVGTIFYVGSYKGSEVVAIAHGANPGGNAMVSMIYHVQNIKVKRGQRVGRGEQIAEMGTTGPQGVGMSIEVKDGDQNWLPLADVLPPREAAL